MLNLCRVSLNTAQPSLSSAIQHLESQFNTQLLIRYKAKGVALTPAGKKFVAEARQLLLHTDELTKNMGDFGKKMEGEFTLGCYITIAPFFIPELLNQAKLNYPNLSIKAKEKNLDEIQHDLFDGLYELALLYKINLADGIKTITVKHCRPYVVVSKQHPLANRKRIALKELAEESYIMLDLPNSRDYFRNVFSNNNVSPKIVHRTRSFEMVRSLVAQKHGYSILNLLPQNHTTYDGSRVSCIELTGKQKPLEIVLAHVESLKLTRRAKEFSGFCETFFETH